MLCLTAQSCNRDLSSFSHKPLSYMPAPVSSWTCHVFLWEPKRSRGQVQSLGLCPISSTLLWDCWCHCPLSLNTTLEKMTWGRKQRVQNLWWHRGCSQPWLWFGNNHNPCNREELDAHCSAAYSGPVMAPRTSTRIFRQTSSRHLRIAWSTVAAFSTWES